MTKQLPKISIIIPVYNVSQYIERCLDSVINQTYKDIECILVDDCGKDDSVAKCEAYIEQYKGDIHFEICHHEHNRGLSAARNTGFDHASGEYVYYMDSDDELPRNAIELLVAKVKEHPDVEMVQGYTVSIPHDDYYESLCFSDHGYVTDNLWIRYNYYKIGKTIPVNGWNKLLKTDFIKKYNLYFLEGIIHEDEHWMWYLVKHLTTMAFVFEPTYIHYYLNEGGIMTMTTMEKSGRNIKIIIFDFLDHMDDVLLPYQVQKILNYYSYNEVYRVCSRKEEAMILNEVQKILWNNRLFRSLCWLLVWRMTHRIKNVKRILRWSTESIPPMYFG